MKKYILIFFLAILMTSGTALGRAPLDTAIAISMQQTSDRIFDAARSDTVLSLAAAKTVSIDHLDFTAYMVKVLDQGEDHIYTYWYDSDLVAITGREAFQSRAVAYQQQYGHLDRQLYDRMQQEGAAQQNIPVAVWAEQSPNTNAEPSGPFRIFLPLTVGSQGGHPISQINAFLLDNGYTADYVSAEAPVVYAEIPPSLIWDLQSQSYVAAIYEQADTQLAMSSAARTTAAPWTWSRGITGNGIRVAVLEDDGVEFKNPYINGSKYHIGWLPKVGKHATNVAGVIASTHSEQRGIAYGAEILSANAFTPLEVNLIGAADWALDQDVDIINASFGMICKGRSIQSIDKYFDWVVWNKRTTVTVSAGNLRPECPDNYNVSSPGKAYNVITVGAKNDLNTAETEEDVSDDIFSSFSMYIDPTTASENRLKPEVVAVGERIITTSKSSPWIETSETQGTSFSAPIVAGQAALMMERRDWLTFSPEALKAGIMATARWTFLRDDENNNQWASVDKMGVGAVDTTAADNSLINDRIQELYLEHSDFTDGHYDINFDGIAGQRIRVVITWSSHPSRVILNWILHDRLESDFDLTVTSPSGQIFGSYADEANYEIVEFVAPQDGQYRARIHLSRWDDSDMQEKIGFAWYSGLPLP